MATQMQPASITNTDSVFKQSHQDGVSWALYGDMPALSDSIIVEYVRDNILGEAFEPPLSPETVTRNTAFYSGYRFKLELPVSEESIVAIIRNLCEIAQEGWLSEELLRRDAGQVAGWIVLGMSA